MILEFHKKESFVTDQLIFNVLSVSFIKISVQSKIASFHCNFCSSHSSEFIDVSGSNIKKR